MRFQGKSWKFPNDVDTDVIIPARYLMTTDEKELAEHVMEDIDPDFAGAVEQGDIIVAGKNFGCGSSREHAPIAIKAAGVSCVVAESYARIFYRNAINIGLPIVECPEAVQDAEPGDVLEVDTEEGWVLNTRTGNSFEILPFPEKVRNIIAAGGLMADVARIVREREQATNGERDGGADHDVPGPGDRAERGGPAREPFEPQTGEERGVPAPEHHRGHQDGARTDRDDRVALRGAAVQHAQEEAAEQPAVGEGGDRQPELDDRRVAGAEEERAAHEHHTPEQREEAQCRA
jgi:3-isopropylmalate/(R)-2-methylmalate dehydratase small subunit